MSEVGWSELESCASISERDTERAASSIGEMHAFLLRVAHIARPDDGAPNILAAFARLAAKPWPDTELRVELTGDECRTTLSLVYDGGAARERLLPQIEMPVPVDEFICAFLASPRLAAPLEVTVADDALVLRMPARATQVPPTVRLPNASTGPATKTAPPTFAVGAIRGSGLHSLKKLQESLLAPGSDLTVPPEVYTKTTVPRLAVVDPRLLVPRHDPRREED